MADGQEQPHRRPEADLPDVRSGADLRCSDVDRDRVAEALREAATDGRLTLTELDERIDATFKARTYGDLQPITRDLPQGPYPVPGAAAPAPQWQRDATAGAAPTAGTPAAAQNGQPPVSGSAPPTERVSAILSTEKRKGHWEVPQRLDLTTVLGEIVIDVTDAVVRSPEVDIHVGAVLGSVTLIMPEGADVRMEHGANVLGERKMRLRSPAETGGPVYRVRGFVVLGEITVRPPRR